ncbi:unnamed protein product [Lactuca virosa]|uniref:FRIGIDA-like protein n=1 Tax=Lactuca virosa TaxID=75947 RepID=A0AAU9N2Z0_9ASTR|nr:unnamed protein product [Lactuca virosa]
MDERMHSVETTTSTTTIETSTSSIPITTVSPTFFGVIQEPITTIFSSHSPKAEKTIQEDEADDDNVMVSFVELQFGHEEEDIPDDLFMSVKQFKILNCKMISILQFLADTGNKHSISGVEVEYLLKTQESRLKTLIENVDKRSDDQVVTQSCTFNHDISKLRDVEKEHHELF